jgi:hypothetical protein
MIIGNGDIASVLKDREDRLYFASGVSNSKETRREEYEREKKLLLKQDKYRHIVYFSSLAIFYSDQLYAQHKKRMENLIKKRFKHHTIIRIGNITWGKNPHTIINFLKYAIKNNKKFEIQDVYRYVVDKEEFLYWVNLAPDWSCEINIPGRRMKVGQIVEEIKQGKL